LHGGEVIADGEEQVAELLALLAGEAGQEFVFGLALGLCASVELSLAGGGQGDDVAAAVGGVADA
jgi:hypothetical protein